MRRLNATNRVANPGDVGLGDGGRSACGGPSGDESGDGILERLHATGVGYSYTAFDAPVLSDVDCDIRKGDKIAIVGPTGSGKSTLLKLLAGLIEPVCGTVTINGRRMPDLRRGQPMEGRQAGVCASGIHGVQRNLARQYHAAPSVADG